MILWIVLNFATQLSGLHCLSRRLLKFWQLPESLLRTCHRHLTICSLDFVLEVPCCSLLLVWAFTMSRTLDWVIIGWFWLDLDFLSSLSELWSNQVPTFGTVTTLITFWRSMQLWITLSFQEKVWCLAHATLSVWASTLWLISSTRLWHVPMATLSEWDIWLYTRTWGINFPILNMQSLENFWFHFSDRCCRFEFRIHLSVTWNFGRRLCCRFLFASSFCFYFLFKWSLNYVHGTDSLWHSHFYLRQTMQRSFEVL